MGKFTDLRDWIDNQEFRFDFWLQGLKENPRTARIVIAVVLVSALSGLWLWLG